MFTSQSALFIYCVSPVHMGAGTALGLIDNPIQRERHTEYPMFAGSGIKGAVRHMQWARLPADARGRNGADKRRDSLLARLFGPDSGDTDLHAGAISFGDAQLAAFPVRCARAAYVYATSPTALARVRRTLALAGIQPPWSVPSVESGRAAITGPDLLMNEDIILEASQFKATVDKDLMAVSSWLSGHALPQDPEYQYFRDKLRDHMVLLPDEEFGYFVRNATVVEPHVRINDETGTADGGGLFYTENLPPESLLVAPLMASAERSGRGDDGLSAEQVLEAVLEGNEALQGLDGTLLQVGGDATTGRGQVVLRAVRGGGQ